MLRILQNSAIRESHLEYASAYQQSCGSVYLIWPVTYIGNLGGSIPLDKNLKSHGRAEVQNTKWYLIIFSSLGLILYKSKNNVKKNKAKNSVKKKLIKAAFYRKTHGSMNSVKLLFLFFSIP